jgi:hypothetical protein
MNNEQDKQPIVFITQYIKNLKFSDAERFGQVRFLTDQEYRPCPAIGVNEKITLEIKKNISYYLPGTDYILLTGSSIPNFIVGTYLMKFGELTHNILKWDNRQHRYEVFSVKII